jgi:hypothetical protein
MKADEPQLALSQAFPQVRAVSLGPRKLIHHASPRETKGLFATSELERPENTGQLADCLEQPEVSLDSEPHNQRGGRWWRCYN